MHWDTFQQETGFEALVLDLTRQSISTLQQSELGEESYSAFAFNCSSYDGGISLSFGTDPGYEDSTRKTRHYPPDWEHECMECDLPRIKALWDENYEPIRKLFSGIVERLDDAESFCQGYLNSLRRVMVRLEREAVLRPLSHEKVWTLVTEIDADTVQEEQRLEAVRISLRPDAGLPQDGGP